MRTACRDSDRRNLQHHAVGDDEDSTLTETMLAVICTQVRSLQWLHTQALAIGLAGAQVAALVAFTRLTYPEVCSRLSCEGSTSAPECLPRVTVVLRKTCSKGRCVATAQSMPSNIYTADDSNAVHHESPQATWPPIKVLVVYAVTTS